MCSIFEIITQQLKQNRKTPDLGGETQTLGALTCTVVAMRGSKQRKSLLIRLQILYALTTLGRH